MERLEKVREKIKALSESEAKSMLMLIAAKVNMVSTGDGSFTRERCIEEIEKMFQQMPLPENRST
jgi:hypothetical protein